MNQHPNATAAGLSGACVTLGLYIATLLGWNPPPEIPAAIVTVISAAVLLIPGPKKKANNSWVDTPATATRLATIEEGVTPKKKVRPKK